MALGSSAIPDIQDLDSAFSLDDCTNIIAEIELVTESLNEEPVQAPPTVAEKPKKAAPPSVAEKPKKFLHQCLPINIKSRFQKQ